MVDAAVVVHNDNDHIRRNEKKETRTSQVMERKERCMENGDGEGGVDPYRCNLRGCNPKTTEARGRILVASKTTNGSSSSHNDDIHQELKGDESDVKQNEDADDDSMLIVDTLRERFEKYGFIILENCFHETYQKELLNDWYRFSEQFFQYCFHVLHHNGHISIDSDQIAPEAERAEDGEELKQNLIPTRSGSETSNTSTKQQPTNNEMNLKRYTLGLSAKNGFEEIVMRSPGRYEISLLNFYRNLASRKTTRQQEDRHHQQDREGEDHVEQQREQSSLPPSRPLPTLPIPNHPSYETLIESTILSKLIPSLLHSTNGDKMKLCHVSLLVGTPGCVEQSWHIDGGHVSLTEHLPCHVFNIFIPLVNIPHIMGPTELRPGTHVHSRNLGPMLLVAKCRKTLLKPYVATLNLGDILIFDYRVLHRGKANTIKPRYGPTKTTTKTTTVAATATSSRSNNHRTFLVLTYSQPWFEDVVNFPKRSMLDAVGC